MSRLPDRRYHLPKSQPSGRRDMRAHQKVRFNQRMKPRSWPASVWFASALFARGIPSRKKAFAALLRFPDPTIRENRHD